MLRISRSGCFEQAVKQALKLQVFEMRKMIVSGARVITPGRDLGAVDVRIENGVIACVGAKVSPTNRSRRA
jgi:hypothetical protein